MYSDSKVCLPCGWKQLKSLFNSCASFLWLLLTDYHHNKTTKFILSLKSTKSLKITHTQKYSLTVLVFRMSKSVSLCHNQGGPAKALGRIIFLLPPDSGSCRGSLAYGCITLIFKTSILKSLPALSSHHHLLCV